MSNGLRQEDPLRRLLEKDSVITVVNGLFRSVDEKDWTKATTCLAPHVALDMTSVTGEEPLDATAAAVVDGWRQSLSHLEAIHHQAGNYEVEVHGEEAAATCYGTAFHYLPNDAGLSTRMFVGTYDLHLIKYRGGWRIDAVRYNLKFIDGNADLEGRQGTG